MGVILSWATPGTLLVMYIFETDFNLSCISHKFGLMFINLDFGENNVKHNHNTLDLT
jgi:hypothetical protein